LLQQALTIVNAKPCLIDSNPSAARELCALIWRAMLSRYARGISGAKDQAAAFRDWMVKDVLPLIAGIADAECRRRWFFELVVSDKASVEYALARQVVVEAQHILEPLVSSSSLGAARNWLRNFGNCAADALAFNLILDADKWLPQAYGATDTDTGKWAIDALSKGVYERLHKSFESKRVHFATTWSISPFIQLPPMCAAEVAAAAVRVSADLLAPNRLAELGFKNNLRSVSVEFFTTLDAARPIRLRTNLSLNSALDQRDLKNSCGQFLDFNKSANPSFRSHPNRTSATFEADVPLTMHAPVLPQDWLNFLNALKQEYTTYRTTGIAINDFFDRAWQTFPSEIESSYSTPAEYLGNWSWVMQTVCDRFWGMFMTRIVHGKEDERSALELIHELKKDFVDLLQINENANYNAGYFQQKLAKIRQEIINLDHRADALLGQEISGREPVQFDLRAVVEQRLSDCFGESAISFLSASAGATIVVGNRYDFERIVDELLNNAKNHGNLTGVTVEWRTSVDWFVRVNTAARDGQPRGNGLGTGQGMQHARATAVNAGYFWKVPTPNPGEPFVAVFGLGLPPH
jgi:hypothetical protein